MKWIVRLMIVGFLCIMSTNVLAQFPTRVVPDTRQIHNIVVADSVMDQLHQIWRSGFAQGKENGACLYGNVNSDTLFLQGTGPASTQNATLISVEMACPDNVEGFIGTAHSHLFPPGYPSTQDMQMMLRSSLPLIVVIWTSGITIVTRDGGIAIHVFER